MIHLEGNNAPVLEEREATPTRVVGTVPEDLHGTFRRNGPNPRSGWSPHLFAGDGMVHAVALPSGAYRNRYVRTPLFEDPTTRRDGRFVTTANTHVIDHAGRTLALEEGGLPYELAGTLDTVGPFSFDGRLRTAMTAHPKTCPATGDLLFFGYSVVPPFLTYHRATRDGELVESVPIDLPRCSLMHDFAITESHVVFYDSPYVFDGSPWRWDAHHGARIGVMRRGGGEVRWFAVDTAHLSHSANAHDDADSIVLSGTRIGSPESLPMMHRWRVDLVTGVVEEGPLDDISSEYPRVPDTLLGRRNRFTYTSSFFYVAEPDHGAVNKHDGDSRITRTLPAGHTCGEPVFVARPSADAEDDGHLLTFAHDRSEGTSYLLVLDAGTLETEAEVHLPVRVPGGFHGSWVAGAA